MILGFFFVLRCIFRVLSMYNLKDGDIGNAIDISQSSAVAHASPLETQLPTVELLKVCIACPAI